MNEFYYSAGEKNIVEKMSYKLSEMLGGEVPVIVCIGTDATIGDSLGPICGTFIENKRKDLFVYGSLNKTVTAKEVRTMTSFIEKVHPFSKVIAIDAAVGRSSDVGSFKISAAPLKPGLGANKDLPEIGDVSIIAIIGEKTKNNFEFMNMTRLSPVFEFARIIADTVLDYCNGIESAEKKHA